MTSVRVLSLPRSPSPNSPRRMAFLGWKLNPAASGVRFAKQSVHVLG